MSLSAGIISLLLSSAAAAPSYGSSPLTVRTSTGYYKGRYDQNFTGVREYLNVPYGQTTGGKNRFMPPKAVPMSSETFDATDYAPFCPQYVSGNPAIWNQQIPQYLSLWNYTKGDFFKPENFQSGEPAVYASEDCLSLAIWTPAKATSVSQLPVAMFWTGGGYQTNGILVPGQLPPSWVSRTQEHIVVTINCTYTGWSALQRAPAVVADLHVRQPDRMNIMGFPNAGGIPSQNLGLLDQRLALEWVRDNIVHFGTYDAVSLVPGTLAENCASCRWRPKPHHDLGSVSRCWVRGSVQFRILGRSDRARHLRTERQCVCGLRQ